MLDFPYSRKSDNNFFEFSIINNNWVRFSDDFLMVVANSSCGLGVLGFHRVIFSEEKNSLAFVISSVLSQSRAI